jgi:hypothetical protein
MKPDQAKGQYVTHSSHSINAIGPRNHSIFIVTNFVQSLQNMYAILAATARCSESHSRCVSFS